MTGDQKIIARVVVEMMGGPKDHLATAFNQYIEKLKKDQTISILNTHIAEPESVSDKMFSVFAELEIAFPTAIRLFSFSVDALPSSIEILEPESVSYQSPEFASLLNDILAQLHAVNKNYAMLDSQAKLIDSNAVNLLKNFVIHLVKSGSSDAQAMSKAIGMPAKSLSAFLSTMEKDQLLIKKGEQFALP